MRTAVGLLVLFFLAFPLSASDPSRLGHPQTYDRDAEDAKWEAADGRRRRYLERGANAQSERRAEEESWFYWLAAPEVQFAEWAGVYFHGREATRFLRSDRVSEDFVFIGLGKWSVVVAKRPFPQLWR
jgi:hypothetical protein